MPAPQLSFCAVFAGIFRVLILNSSANLEWRFMAAMAMTIVAPKVMVSTRWKPSVSLGINASRLSVCSLSRKPNNGLTFLFSYGKDFRHQPWPLFAVGSGLEASISEKSKDDLRLDNAKVVIESRDDDKIHVRVDLTAEETEKAFDDVLVNLARTAPPIPGFRRTKGGKTSNVPKSFLLQILGRDRVTKFLIQEILSVTIRDFVEKENLKVKSQFTTIQTAEELEATFTPGSVFGFNATIDIDKPDSEGSSSSSS